MMTQIVFGFPNGFLFYFSMMTGVSLPIRRLVELLESDVLGVLPEALPAHVEGVLTDHTVAVGAGAAERNRGRMYKGNGLVSRNGNQLRRKVFFSILIMRSTDQALSVNSLSVVQMNT